MPSSFLDQLPTFAQIDVDLSANQITSIDPAICSKSNNWNYGDVERYGCDGLLCPTGFYSELGRRSSDSECTRCSDASYFGTTECGSSGGSGAALAVSLTIVFLLLIGSVTVYIRLKQTTQALRTDEAVSLQSRYEDACIT